MAVHMVGVAEAARVALTLVCDPHALRGCMSEARLIAAGRMADVLARLLDPMGASVLASLAAAVGAGAAAMQG